MARISKTDHPRILHLVEVERRKVVQVAAEYGCTPANIYALLGKMRRERVEDGVDSKTMLGTATEPPSGVQRHEPAGTTGASPEVADPADLFPDKAVEVSSPPIPVIDSVVEVDMPATKMKPSTPAEASASATAPKSGASDQLPMALRAAPTEGPTSPPALVKDLPQKTASGSRAGTGGTLVKNGFGLAMRTADGDETTTPFRSLDDLLSAIKPILRSAARSPDAVWFSIQPVDLATLEVDTA